MKDEELVEHVFGQHGPIGILQGLRTFRKTAKRCWGRGVAARGGVAGRALATPGGSIRWTTGHELRRIHPADMPKLVSYGYV